MLVRKSELTKEFAAKHNLQTVKAVPATRDHQMADLGLMSQGTHEEFQADRREQGGHEFYSIEYGSAADKAYQEIRRQRHFAA